MVWYGVLINIVDHESGRVEVLWESDGKTSMTYLNKLHLESKQTLDVTSSSVSSSVSYSAAVLPDSCTTDSVPDKPLYELLYKGKVIFHGEQVTEAHATVAHGTKLAKTEYKFLIKKVLNSHLFDNYDEDMTQGSYIRWPKKNIRLHTLNQWLAPPAPPDPQLETLDNPIQAGFSGRTLLTRKKKKVDYTSCFDDEDSGEPSEPTEKKNKSTKSKTKFLKVKFDKKKKNKE